MGIPKQRWTTNEEEALRAGIAKYGTGKWKNIKADPEFRQVLTSRSNIDLKDKWRNMAESRIPKANPNQDATATPLLITQASASSNPAAHDAPADAAEGDFSKCSLDEMTDSKYNTMIREALSTLEDPNGSDFNAIACFFQDRHKLSHDFRKSLSSRLRRLVEQDKLEKVQNCYRIKSNITSEIEEPTSKRRQIQPLRLETYSDSVQDAANVTARLIADAERTMFIAIEAKEKEERFVQMADNANLVLELAQGIYEKCCREEMFQSGA